VSDQAKDLVKKMLTQDPAKRITAEGVLQHPWIKGYEHVSHEHLPETLDELRKFNARQKFRGAALACIASNRLSRFMMSSKATPGGYEDMIGGLNFTAEELEKLKEAFATGVQGKHGLAYNDFKVGQWWKGSVFIKVVSVLAWLTHPRLALQ